MAASSFWYHRLARLAPTKPPAHTIGASGPTLNPKDDVTKLSNRRGPKCSFVLGRVWAGKDDNAETKSATANVDPSLVDNNPMINPPIPQILVITYVGLRLPNSFITRLGKVFQIDFTHTLKILPYKNPIVAVIIPTIADAGMMLSSSSFAEAAAISAFGDADISRVVKLLRVDGDLWLLRGDLRVFRAPGSMAIRLLLQGVRALVADADDTIPPWLTDPILVEKPSEICSPIRPKTVNRTIDLPPCRFFILLLSSLRTDDNDYSYSFHIPTIKSFLKRRRLILYTTTMTDKMMMTMIDPFQS